MSGKARPRLNRTHLIMEPSQILYVCFTLILSIIFIHPATNGQQRGYQGYVDTYNQFGLQSLIIPIPCQANKLQEQVNYICAHGTIWCLPGWKVKYLIVFNTLIQRIRMIYDTCMASITTSITM